MRAVVATAATASMPAVRPTDAFAKDLRYNVCPQSATGCGRRRMPAIVPSAVPTGVPAAVPSDALRKDLRYNLCPQTSSGMESAVVPAVVPAVVTVVVPSARLQSIYGVGRARKPSVEGSVRPLLFARCFVP